MVIRVPDHFTGDAGAQGGQFHVMGHGSDLGKADCIRHAIEQEEDAERLSADDPSAGRGSNGQRGDRCWPAFGLRHPRPVGASMRAGVSHLGSWAAGSRGWERCGFYLKGRELLWMRRKLRRPPMFLELISPPWHLQAVSRNHLGSSQDLPVEGPYEGA